MIAPSKQAAGKKELVVCVETDVLFSLHQQQTVASLLTERGLGVTFRTLLFLQGQDAFLVDGERFVPGMADFFARL